MLDMTDALRPSELFAFRWKSFDDVMKTTVYLADMKDFGAMNTVYARYFQAPYPARTTIQAAGLPLGAAVEIEVVAR